MSWKQHHCLLEVGLDRRQGLFFLDWISVLHYTFIYI